MTAILKRLPIFLKCVRFQEMKQDFKEDADDYANDIMICFEAQPDNSEESVYEVIMGSGIYNRDDIAFSHRKLEYFVLKSHVHKCQTPCSAGTHSRRNFRLTGKIAYYSDNSKSFF